MPPLLSRDERRSEPRRATHLPGVVTAPALEMGCVITDQSESGLRIRLARAVAIPDRVVVVEIGAGVAHEAEVRWRKGHEAGLKRLSTVPLRGLTPQRLTAARDAWKRAGGR